MQLQKRYGIMIQKFRLINAGVSCVFYLTTPRYQAYYIRFTHPKFHTLEAVKNACDFQNYLHYHSAYVPTIRVDSKKESAFAIEIGGENYTVSMSSAAYGDVVSTLDYNEEMWNAIGESIAKMHLAASHYAKNPPFISWQDLWQETLANRKFIPAGFDQTEFSKIDTWLQQLPQEKKNYGITHADCRPGNFIYDGERITIIDFDEPVYHWYAADIARAIVDLYEYPEERKLKICQALFKGYHAIKPLSVEVREQLPYFMRMKDIGIYTWCRKMGEELPNTSLSLKTVEQRLLDKNWYLQWEFLNTP